MKRSRMSWLGAALLIAGLATNSEASEPSRVYDANCALCHQRAGVGLVGQFPRLAGRVAEMSATPEGRTFLMQVSLFGMAGRIEVDGVPIVGVMPGFASLSNEEIAEALNYLIALEGKVKTKTQRVPVSASDVEKVRESKALSATDVLAGREKALVRRKG